MEGILPSYYLKQILQTALKDLPDIQRVENRVHAVSSTGVSSANPRHEEKIGPAMNSTIERLLSLKVGDVMTERIVTLCGSSTMSEAAQTLNRHQVSGAPVVDKMGHCIGILSGSDFIREKANACEKNPPAYIPS